MSDKMRNEWQKIYYNIHYNILKIFDYKIYIFFWLKREKVFHIVYKLYTIWNQEMSDKMRNEWQNEKWVTKWEMSDKIKAYKINMI
jgi:hypothetical protein